MVSLFFWEIDCEFVWGVVNVGEYADLEVDEIIAGFERRAEKQIAKKDLKPNQCDVCGKRFWTSEARNQHAKDAHK